ncbi:MAG TPA: glycosyltransferase family 4 protein [Longimicrobium sp.]|uniref:glycosyltransferase family 4 protein n=1 Tax=Longimicrobium sp. TaxID=2029185 RepID=UPI002ED804F4
MKIVYLSASGALGGAERALLDLLASLRSAQPSWSLCVVAGEDGPLLGRVRELGVESRLLPFPRALSSLGDAGSAAGGMGRAGLLAGMAAAGPAAAAYALRLRRMLGDLAPDIIHTNGFKMHLLAAGAGPRGVPVVWHLHDFVSARPAMRGLLRAAAGRCAAALAVSDAVAADARTAFGAGFAVHTVLNAVDLSRFRPEGEALDLAARAGLRPAPPSTVNVGLVATMGLWKGHEVFLRALAALPADAAVRGYVVGGGIYRTAGSEVSVDDLRRRAADLGIADRVGFTGLVEDPAAAMRALDVVVHASTQPEPFGLVIAEAMACGRALIVSDAGGAREIVHPEHDALTAVPGDAASLSSAIQRLAADPALRAELGRRGRETALRDFDRARLARQMAPLYRSLAPAPPPR